MIPGIQTIREALQRREADWIASGRTSLYDQGAMDAYGIALGVMEQMESELTSLVRRATLSEAVCLALIPDDTAPTDILERAASAVAQWGIDHDEPKGDEPLWWPILKYAQASLDAWRSAAN